MIVGTPSTSEMWAAPARDTASANKAASRTNDPGASRILSVEVGKGGPSLHVAMGTKPCWKRLVDDLEFCLSEKKDVIMWCCSNVSEIFSLKPNTTYLGLMFDGRSALETFWITAFRVCCTVGGHLTVSQLR